MKGEEEKKLVIEKDTIYEIDLTCVKCKEKQRQRRKENKEKPCK